MFSRPNESGQANVWPLSSDKLSAARAHLAEIYRRPLGKGQTDYDTSRCLSFFRDLIGEIKAGCPLPRERDARKLEHSAYEYLTREIMEIHGNQFVYIGLQRLVLSILEQITLMLFEKLPDIYLIGMLNYTFANMLIWN